MFKKMIISAALACAFCSASSAMAAWPVWDEFRNDALDNGRVVDKSWISRVAEAIDIPFCVAGGIRTVEDAGRLLAYGADKISVNSPALADPDLISRLADRFGVLGHAPNTNVILDIDRNGFVDLLVEAAEHYNKKEVGA